MNEPLVWTIIGALAASLFGGLTVITQLILRSEIGSLRAVTESKFESLDLDIQGLTRHVFGSNTPD